MIPSPYTPGSGVAPHALVGRQHLLDRIGSELLQLRTAGRSATPVTIFTGARGLGKTVLLARAEHTAAEQGFLVAHVPLDKTDAGVSRIVQALAEAAAPLSGQTRFWNRIIERLHNFSLEVSAAGIVKASAVFGSVPEPDQIAREQLRALLVEVSTAAREQQRQGLVLALDEVQDCPSPQLAAIAHAMQDATAAGAPMLVLGAGLAHTPDVLMAAASFTERFRYTPIERLDTDEALLALLLPARDQGIAWSPEATTAVLTETKGSPYLIQLYGHEVWLLAEPTPGGMISLQHAQKGIASAESLLDGGLFRGRWGLASAAERELLIATAGCLNDGGTATMADVAGAMGKTTKQLSMARQRLIDKGLIEAPRHNQIAFTIPGFERFVLRQADMAPGFLLPREVHKPQRSTALPPSQQYPSDDPER